MSAFANDGMIMLNVLVDSNQALTGSGGGVLLKTFNGKSKVIKSQFTNNMANVDKSGAVYMGSSQYSLLFDRCNFTDNQASSGGGIFISLGNGVGPFGSSDDQIVFDNCIISDNVASLYAGGLYLEERNYVQVNETIVDANQALSGDAGGIGVGTLNSLTLKSLHIRNNEAQSGCGGGIALMQSTNKFYTRNIVDVTYNKAMGGGGICDTNGFGRTIDIAW